MVKNIDQKAPVVKLDSEASRRNLYFDTATLYYRAFFAVPESITAPDGTPSGAVRGFLDMVSAIAKQFPPNQVVFAWDDDWRPQWRVDLIPSYKLHRIDETTPDQSDASIEVVPDALSPQIDAISLILDSIGLPRIGQIGHEADDVLGALVSKVDGPCDVVTGDRDLFQLVSDDRDSRVVSITKGVKNLEVVDDAYLINRYGVSGSQYADFSMLRGDASDGLPGVKGIGEKTAAKLVNEYRDVSGLISAAKDSTSDLASAVRRNLLESQDYMKAAGKVVRVKTTAKIPKRLEPPKTVSDGKSLQELVDAWGIEKQVKRFLKTLNIDRVA
jgi:5'-3' exonuclease